MKLIVFVFSFVAGKGGGAGVGVFGIGLSELVAPFLLSTEYVTIPMCSQTSNIVIQFSLFV